MIKGYLAVGNKCAVDLSLLDLPISDARSLEILWQKGFRVVDVDLVAVARKRVGVSRYHRGVGAYVAPFTVDCSTLTKWLYAKIGIWLPRHSVDQREMGQPIEKNGEVTESDIEPGDLIFVEGFKPYWDRDREDGVGHVGICTGEHTVIHAADPKRGVVEDPLSRFASFRGIRRIKTRNTITLESPSNRMIEWSGEIKRIIAQGLDY